MRHRVRGRKLGRNSSHRKALLRNMACSLIRSVRDYSDLDEASRLQMGLGYAPKVPGRIVTTVSKAKYLRPFVEKLVTMARKAAVIEEQAEQYATTAERNSEEWRAWRTSEQWNQWNQAIAPALALRRRAFALLRDNEAVDILFDELAERFADRPGGYTRVVRLASFRLGDAAPQALIEFVGERDRQPTARRQAPAVVEEEAPPAEETASAPAADASSGPAEATADETEETEKGETASAPAEQAADDEDAPEEKTEN